MIIAEGTCRGRRRRRNRKIMRFYRINIVRQIRHFFVNYFQLRHIDRVAVFRPGGEINQLPLACRRMGEVLVFRRIPSLLTAPDGYRAQLILDCPFDIPIVIQVRMRCRASVKHGTVPQCDTVRVERTGIPSQRQTPVPLRHRTIAQGNTAFFFRSRELTDGDTVIPFAVVKGTVPDRHPAVHPRCRSRSDRNRINARRFRKSADRHLRRHSTILVRCACLRIIPDCDSHRFIYLCRCTDGYAVSTTRVVNIVLTSKFLCIDLLQGIHAILPTLRPKKFACTKVSPFCPLINLCSTTDGNTFFIGLRFCTDCNTIQIIYRCIIVIIQFRRFVLRNIDRQIMRNLLLRFQSLYDCIDDAVFLFLRQCGNRRHTCGEKTPEQRHENHGFQNGSASFR